MKLKWILTGLVALVVAVVVAGVAILSTMDFEEYRGVIEAEAEKATGRKLTIAGAIDLSLSLTPAIAVEDIRFANADWGSRPEMLSVKRFELEVAILPLFSGDIQVKRLVVVAPDILLETDAEGRGNWEMAGMARDETAKDETASRETVLPGIDNAVVRDAVVTYRDGKTGESIQLSFSKMALRRTSAAVPLEVTLEGAYNGVPFKADGAAGLIRDLIGAKPYPVRLTLVVGGATLAIDGSIAEAMTGQGLDLKVQARGQSLADLGAAVGAELPALGPYDVSAQVAQDGQSYKLTGLTAKIGGSDIAGNATLTLGGERPALSGSFTSANLNLNDFASEGGTPGGGAAPAPAGEQRYVFTEEPLPFDGLKAVDAKIKLSAKRLVLPNGLAFTELEAALSLKGGKLVLEPFSTGFSGGTLAGSVSLDAGKKAPPLTVKLSASGIDYGGLLKALEVTEGISGRLDAELDLRGAGASLRAIVAGLDGRIEVTGGAGGISNDLVQAAGAGLTQMLSGWTEEGGGDLRLNCIVARLPVKGGVASGEVILLDTAAATVGGAGEIDLRDESLDLKVTPQAKQTSLLSLAVPFLIQGTLAEPKVIPDPVGTAVGVAKIAGLFINPLAAGAMIVAESETSDQNPCVAALERPAPASGTTAAQPQPQPQPEKSTVESTTEGLGSAVEGAAEGVGGALEGVGEGISEGLKSLFGN